MNILIIEDIDFRQALIKSKLENLSFTSIDCSNNAEKATELLKEKNMILSFLTTIW